MSVYIIAEAGVNHNGDTDIAKKLVDAAVSAGADAVKFQMFHAEKLASVHAQKAEYQKITTGSDSSQLDMLKALELNEDSHRLLKDYCQVKGIDFLSSPFDIDSLRFLLSIGMEVIKIPSGEITNYPMLVEAAGSGKKLILSTGMCDLNEVRDAVNVIKSHSSNMEKDCDRLTLLHCNTQYPTPYEHVNLEAMLTLRDEFGTPVGYSDHTRGIEIPIAAVALGATVIEKHFTLDKNMEGPDHKASLEPDELKQMVESIRHVEMAHGDGVKGPSESETANRAVARKSIVAAVKIAKGDVFTEENLTTKRPGDGISPMRWNEIIGRRADRDYEPDEKIESDHT